MGELVLYLGLGSNTGFPLHLAKLFANVSALCALIGIRRAVIISSHDGTRVTILFWDGFPEY